MIRTTVSLYENTEEYLRVMSRASGMSKSTIVNIALHEYVKNNSEVYEMMRSVYEKMGVYHG